MNIVNALVFNATWFGCVLGGELWGSVGLVCLMIHTMYDKSYWDFLLAGLLGIFGWFLDSAWVAIGVLDYSGIDMAPMWIAILWCALGLSMNKCMQWFLGHPILGAFIAGISAPVSYLSAERLGATTVVDVYGLAAISLAWGVVFGCLFNLLQNIRGRYYGHAY